MNKRFFVLPRTITGSAIVITILTISALLTVALGTAQIVPQDYRQSIALESSVAAENAAWAGVEHGLLLLRENQSKNQFTDLSSEYVLSGMSDPSARPFGQYSAADPSQDCLLDRTVCRGVDRQLGLSSSTPQTIDGVISTANDPMYQLIVWHRRVDVGNPNDLNDGLPESDQKNLTRSNVNINAILDRDEVRRLDLRDVTSQTIKWKPVFNSSCVKQAASDFYVIYTYLDQDNSVISRGVSQANIDAIYNQIDVVNPGATTLSLRFMVTARNTADSTDDANIKDCFIRYSLTSNLWNGETGDLGFDIIEATGVSAGVRRKIRVLVNRENNRPLNVFDFGVVCQSCRNIN